QNNLAKKVNVRIVMHNREASEDIKTILIEEHAEEVGGIMHSYSSPIEELQTYIDMNFYISLAGPVTFKNAPEVREIAKEIPLNRLLIETDSPYLTPHPYRGKRNEPARVKLIAEEIARVKDISFEELANTEKNDTIKYISVEKLTKITTKNAKRIFRLKN